VGAAMIADAAGVLVAAALGPCPWHVHLSVEVDAEWDLGLLVLQGWFWFHCTRTHSRTVSVFVLTDLSVINFQITTRICVLVAVAVVAACFYLCVCMRGGRPGLGLRDIVWKWAKK